MKHLITAAVVSIVLLMPAFADDPVKLAGLPTGWSKLGLSTTQTQKIREIRTKAQSDIRVLQANIKRIQAEEKALCYQLLSAEQQQRLVENAIARVKP